MAIFNSAVAIVLSAVIALAACTLAVPALKNIASFRTCYKNTVSFNEITGGYNFTNTHKQLNECSNVTFTMPIMPTTFKLNFESDADKKCHYKLVVFSDHDCSASKLLHTFSLNATQNEAKFNKRKSICSYKLRSPSWVPVRVEFGGSSNHTHTFTGNDCVNIENNYCEDHNDHPNSVAVYNTVTGHILEGNSLELFTQRNCLDQLTHRNGSAVEVRQEHNLSEFTREDPQQTGYSYTIKLAR